VSKCQHNRFRICSLISFAFALHFKPHQCQPNRFGRALSAVASATVAPNMNSTAEAHLFKSCHNKQ
jgi:hypothetical protein